MKGESRECFGWGNLAERCRWDQTAKWVETQKADLPEPQGPSGIGETESAVETQNLKRAIAGRRFPRGEFVMQTRKTGKRL